MGIRSGAFLLAAVLPTAGLFCAAARADKKGMASPETSEAVYRETEVTYRNTVTARSFNKSADLTYNPYYAMELDAALVFWVHPKVSTTLDFTLSREITNSDETTRKGEVQLADIFWQAAVRNLNPIPAVGIEAVPSVRLYVPSSKVSKARTMMLGLRAQLQLIKRFDVLRGLAVFYSVAVRKDFHELTTAETELPLIYTPGSTRSADSFFNTGRRNVSVTLFNRLGLALDFTKIIGVEILAEIRHGFLYDIEYEDPRISHEAQHSENVRYQMMYQGEIYGRIGKAWTLALGFLTKNDQLAGDATYEAPFFNRYTAVYLDVRLNAAGLASQLSSKRGKK